MANVKSMGLGRLHNWRGDKGGESYGLISCGKIRVYMTTIYRASCSRFSHTGGTLSSRRIWFKISSILRFHWREDFLFAPFLILDGRRLWLRLHWAMCVL
jgi:hypothetical protein